MARQFPQAGTIEIAPSILSADFGNLCSEIHQVTEAGVRVVHVDVMDGHFVPNITIGPPVIKWIRKCTDAVLDAHLMISEPQKYADAFIDAGVDNITFHIETVNDAPAFVEYLHSRGISAGVTLNPETPTESVLEVAPLCDIVLVMTVHPGFGGQEFMDDAARKCIAIREKVGPNIRIEVDGGINAQTVANVVQYGADTLVAGHAIFSRSDRAGSIETLLSAAVKGG